MVADNDPNMMGDGGGIDIGDGEGGFSFTETTDESWFSRLKKSCSGIAIGLFLFFGSFGLLVWNEKRAVDRQKDLDEGSAKVESYGYLGTDVTVYNSTNGGSLIHVIAPLTTNETLSDPILDIDTSDVIKFRRYVEMYQWSESKRTSTKNGKKKTTYSYSKAWKSSLINSNTFHRSGYNNPLSFPIDNLILEASDVMLGPFSLSDQAVSLLDWYSDHDVTVNISNIKDSTLRRKSSIRDGRLYISAADLATASSSATQIGDARVDFDIVQRDTVTIVARQGFNGELDSFTTSRGGSLLLLRRGEFTAEEMFAKAHADNNAVTWGLRFVGFLVMYISINLILNPFATFVDVIPFVGDILSDGMEKCLIPTVAFFICIPLTLFTIALAWIIFRPIIAGVILGVTALVVAFFVKRFCDKKNAANNTDGDPNNKLDNDVEAPVEPVPHPARTTPVEVEEKFATVPVEEHIPVSYGEPYVPQPYVPEKKNDTDIVVSPYP